MLPVPPAPRKKHDVTTHTKITPFPTINAALTTRHLPHARSRYPPEGGGSRRVSPIRFVSSRTRMAYLCGCDRPRHQQKLSRSFVARLDARGVCGLPLALSALAHGDFPRSMCERSKLLVCQLRSHASRAPSPSEKNVRLKNP